MFMSVKLKNISMTKQASEFESNKNIIPLQHIMLKNTKTILFAAMSYFQDYCMLTILS